MTVPKLYSVPKHIPLARRTLLETVRIPPIFEEGAQARVSMDM